MLGAQHELTLLVWLVTWRSYVIWARLTIVPGFARLDLVAPDGKRLEILIFYRYHLRHSYWRVVRHARLQSGSLNYD